VRVQARHFYAFGPFVVDTAQHLLLREGNLVPLSPKTYDTLLFLVENRGRLLSKNELMQALWPDSFVEEANLTQQISNIRKALGESAGKNGCIVTVPGRGYRFAGKVTEWTEPPGDDERDGTPAPPEQAAQQGSAGMGFATWRRRRLALVAAAVALALAGLLGYKAYMRQPGAEAFKHPTSLAILPFHSLINDPQSEFLGFSLVDAIITKLGYVSSLAVRPSYAVAKYRNQIVDIPKIAAELRVDTLLTGAYIREGGNLRITAQLIDVPGQRILWKQTFDLKYDRLLEVQDDVARQIIKGLELSLSQPEGERLKPDRPVDPLAYEFYLRGVDLYARGDYGLAVGMLEKAASIDSGHALTWAHLGRAYTATASFQFGGRDQYRKAQAAYEQALKLQPDQIEARIYLANFFTDTGQVERAVPLLKRALETNPNHAEVHWELGYAYRFGGMLQESAAECERARQLDPSVKLTSSALNAYLYLGDYDRFLASLPPAPDSAFILFYRGFAEYYRTNFRKAAEDFERAFEADSSLLHSVVGKALSAAIEHKNREGLAMLHETADKIEQRGVGDPEAIYKIAQAYVALGDRASALRLLRRSVEGGFFPYPYLNNDPLLAELHGHAEYVRILTLARERHEAFGKLLRSRK
jgi:DNA-binding winged helix-turn-helix (wHTH) protein/TolB-like protein/Tfp pilus assembly protein PilF